MESPLSKAMEKPFHAQEPIFLSLHFLVKDAPGARIVPSGMVTSVRNWATLQLDVAVAAGVLVLTFKVGNGVKVAAVGVILGVELKSGVALVSASTVCAAAVA